MLIIKIVKYIIRNIVLIIRTLFCKLSNFINFDNIIRSINTVSVINNFFVFMYLILISDLYAIIMVIKIYINDCLYGKSFGK